MKSRQQLLAFGFLGLVVLGGLAFLFHVLYLQPLEQRANQITELNKQVVAKQERIREIQANLPRLQQWKSYSLPSDVALAQREYEKMLRVLLKGSVGKPEQFKIIPRPTDDKSMISAREKDKKPFYSRIAFAVEGPATLASTVTLLDKFYRTNLLHQIKSVSLTKPTLSAKPSSDSPQGELEVTLVIEALIVEGAENRRTLFAEGAPARPVLAVPPREYAAIASKDIFFEKKSAPPLLVKDDPKPKPPPTVVDLTQHVYLTDITRTDQTDSACLFNRKLESAIKVAADPEHNLIVLEGSDKKTQFRARVLRVEDRQLLLLLDDEPWVNLKSEFEFQVNEETEAIRVERKTWDRLVKEKVIESVAGTRDTKFRLNWLPLEIVRKDRSDVVFALHPVCALHVGQSLAEALSQPIKGQQLKELKISDSGVKER